MAVLGKRCTLEKNFLHTKCLADHLVSDVKKQKKFPPCLYGYFGWKLGWIYCFFTLKVDCAYAKHCKNSKLTEYVARPIFKHVSSIKFQRKKVITIYLTPQPRRDFLLFNWVRNRMCAPRLYISPNSHFAKARFTWILQKHFVHELQASVYFCCTHYKWTVFGQNPVRENNPNTSWMYFDIAWTLDSCQLLTAEIKWCRVCSSCRKTLKNTEGVVIIL